MIVLRKNKDMCVVFSKFIQQETRKYNKMAAVTIPVILYDFYLWRRRELILHIYEGIL